MTPFAVCVIGKKNSGKTTLTVQLVAELILRGRRVMTVKHGHGFDLDREGTDSWRHRHEGGAERVVMAGPNDLALIRNWGPGGEMGLSEIVQAYLADAEIVVAEGYKADGHPTVEVYRRAAHSSPWYGPDHPHRDTFLAIVTDRPDFKAHVPVISLDDDDRVSRVADLVEGAERSSRAERAD